MKNAMGVGRCCCREVPIVWNSFCRAWNSEINQQFNNVVALSGLMPSGTNVTYPNVNLSDPEDWSFYIESKKEGSLAISYSVQSQTPGIKTKIFGLQNQQVPRSRWSAPASFLKTAINYKVAQSPTDPYPEPRYDNRPSYPARWLTNDTSVNIPNSFVPTFEFKINLRDMSPSVQWDSTVDPELSGYQSTTSLGIMNGQNLYSSLSYFSTVDPGSAYPTTPNVWYFGNFQSPVRDQQGNTISVSFPCEIKFVSTYNKSGTYNDIDLYIDGVKTDRKTIWRKGCKLYGAQTIIWWARFSPVVITNIVTPTGRIGDYGTTYPNLTTPDQIIDIESFEYQIGNSHQEYLNTINWQINSENDDWNYDSGTETISANNSGIFSPREFIKSRYAYATLSLKPNSTYKIEWLSANTDGNTTPQYHPFVVVNNFELSDTSDASRYRDSLFFNTNSSGQTLLKFIGYYNKSFDVSDIRLWLVWEPLNIVYPSPFTNDATSPASNIDWRLVDGSATITPTIGGGKETYIVAVQAGSLPPGCTINSTTGVITLNASHTQATYEVGEVTIRVTDFVGEEYDAVYFWERLP